PGGSRRRTRSRPSARKAQVSRDAPPESRIRSSMRSAPSSRARPSDSNGRAYRAVVDDLVQVLAQTPALQGAATPAGHALGDPGDQALAPVAQRDVGPHVPVHFVGGVLGGDR